MNHGNIEFRKVSGFKRGTLFELLSDAYSFDGRWEDCCGADWKEFDDFFFDNPQIADRYGFITVLNGKAAGLASWDPRKMPEYVEIGHNCIITSCKGPWVWQDAAPGGASKNREKGGEKNHCDHEWPLGSRPADV